MRRRVVAKKVLPASFRAWVKEFQDKDLVRGYRKHYHASWSCAIIELAIMGVSFPEEDIEEANRRQIGAVKSDKARKAKKADAKFRAEFGADYWEVQIPKTSWYECYRDEPERIFELFEQPTPKAVRSGPIADCVDDYDPFVD